MEDIQLKDHRLPVTALQFYGSDLLLSGEGSWLSVFDTQTAKCFEKCRVFRASVIHGIRINSESAESRNLLCVFGGKSLRVIELKDSSIELNNTEIELTDWIQDVKWMNNGKSWKFGIALSHNFVILYDYISKEQICEVHCEDKCILYSGLLLGTSWQSLVLAAGTVFNQVVIWAVEGQKSQEGHAKVIHRLEGHRGVIFSMDFNWERKILCSVSDDRSLRLWQMVLPPGVDVNDQLDWERIKFEPLLELYGHAARVWDCQLLDDCIVSVGEDACCILWDYNGTVLNKFKGHKGKSIWSLATHKSGKLATGGGDCGIRMYNLEMQHQDSKVVTRSLQPPEVDQGQKFFPRTVKLLNSDNVLIMTDEGLLYKYNLPTGQWSILFQSEHYKSYCVLEVSSSREVAALGGVHGNLVILSADLKEEFNIFDRKIHSACWLDSCATSESSSYILLSGPNGLMKLCIVEVTKDYIKLEPHSSYQLPPAKQCWTTCALMLEDEELLLCGDRSGSVHVYEINDPDPKQKFPKVHGKSGVTDMHFYEGHIWSGGRDGQIKEFNVTGDCQVELLHSNKVLKGLQWISKLNFSNGDQLVLGFHTNNFVAYSLLQQQVIVTIPCGGGHRAWDCSFADNHQMSFFYIKSREVFCCQATIEDHVTIIRPSLHGREVTSVATIFPGDQPVIASGSEDTTVNILRLNSDDDSFEIMHTLTGHISSVRTICVVSRMNRPTRRDSRLMFTAGGRAQMTAWRVSQELDNLSSRTDGAAATEDKTMLSNHSAGVQYEHLTTFSLIHKRRRRSRQTNVDPETRIMSVTAFSLQEVTRCDDVESLYVVACGCSDGFLRVYLYDETRPSFKLIFQSDFHDHCLLRVGHVTLGPANQRTTFIYSTATDGRVAFWDTSGVVPRLRKDRECESADPEELSGLESNESCSDPVSLNYTVSLHQSGVNAAAVQQISDNQFLLASGGDDNCVAIVKLTLVENGRLDTKWILKEPNAHATEITGIQFCSDDTVVTASIDQRVTLWNINDAEGKIEFKASRFINVADVSDLVLLNRASQNSFVVSGQGLQTFTISSKS